MGTKQFVYSSLGLIGSGMGLYFAKTKIYDNIKQVNEVEAMINSGGYSSCLFGNLFFIGYLKRGGFDISMLPEDPSNIYKSVKTNPKCAVTNIPGVFEASVGGIAFSFVGYWLFKRYTYTKSFVKKSEDLMRNQEKKTFEDIGGCHEAKEAIKEIIDYISNPTMYKQMGVDLPKGVLLFGPAGTGKTLMAKAAASEAGIPMLYAAGSEFVELYVGLGAKRIRELFTEAREISRTQNTPVMIFIDEIDAVGYKRSQGHGIGFGNRETETTLN